MGQIAKSLLEDLLNHVMTASGYTPVTTVYASLHSADPGHTGANELSYANYSGDIRPVVAFTTPASSRTLVHDNIDLAFPPCADTGVTATHFGLWSSATVGSGVFLGGGVVTDGLIITQGQIPNLSGAEITLTWTAGTTVGVSTYLADKLLDFAFRNQAYTRPTIEMALHTADCSDAGPGTECAGTNYARKAISAWNAAVQGVDDASTANTNEEPFAVPSDETWGQIKALSLLDSVTGNMLFYGNDVVDLFVLTGIAVKAEAGQVTVTLT